VSGIVILELTIGTDGRVTNARVIRSVPLLDQAALDAVRQWVFTPTLLNGVPVPVLMSVTVNFSLDAQPQAETPNAGQPAVSPGGQPDPRAGCRYDADTLATEAPRRQAAVAFVVEVNSGNDWRPSKRSRRDTSHSRSCGGSRRCRMVSTRS
jgi:TonB family protein